MINKLNNKDKKTAQIIRELFQLSYKIEAELINVTNFHPLGRELEGFINCKTEFYGYWKTKNIVGIIEIEPVKSNTKKNTVNRLLCLNRRNQYPFPTIKIVINNFPIQINRYWEGFRRNVQIIIRYSI